MPTDKEIEWSTAFCFGHLEFGNSKTNDIGDHLFSKYQKISEKLTQMTPCQTKKWFGGAMIWPEENQTNGLTSIW